MDPIKKKLDKHEELVRAIVEGRSRFHEVSGDLSAEDAAEVRRQALEEMKGVSLEATGSFTLDADRASRRHCENFIGAIQIPVGITGPLSVRGERVDADEEIYVPLATTEGALVASVNRGCRAIREAGGAVVRVEDVGMTRAPAFRTSGVEQTREFLQWVKDNEEEIRAVTEGTSRYLRLLDIRPQSFGSSIYLRFRFESGEAMGMNMATIA
ncbi:MAG: 3-hydroxy-3-methylglutaryl-CoA reductase, partial [Acidobacteria bacterium]